MVSFLDIFFPKRCLGCGKWGAYICHSCKKIMPLLPYLKCPVCEKPAIDGVTHPKCKTKYSMDGLISFFRYDGIVKKAIKQIKYRYVSSITDDLVFYNALIHTSYIPYRKSIIVPIPLHSSRYRERGFNQAESIANALGRKFCIPVQNDVLIRRKKTIPQVEMKDKEMRLANMKDVFAMKNNFAIQRLARRNLSEGGFHDSVILLVDDVFTTGATLRSATTVLKHAGVKFVWGITVAQ